MKINKKVEKEIETELRDRKSKKWLILILIPIILSAILLYPIYTKYTLIQNERIQISDYMGNPVSFYLNDKYLGTWYNNMTNLGANATNDRLFNSSFTGSFWNYIAIGSGNGTTTNKTRTALVTEIDRESATYYKPANAQFGLNATFTFGSSYTIKEAGVFNAVANGIMLFYVWNLNIGVTSVDTLKITWKGNTSGY